jgi:3-oxoacyl-[acyl-carrier-protein] synthase II
MGVASPIGNTLAQVSRGLRERRSGVVTMDEWSQFAGLRTRLAGVCRDLELAYPRKKVRTMGRVGKLALHATEQAVADAGLTNEELSTAEVGISYGSTHGSSSEMENTLAPLFENKTFANMASSAYLKFMSHTVPANLALCFGIRGRIITTCSACTSGSQGIGYGYEAIKFGRQELMVCGGAEEMHPVHAGVFDVMFATSTGYNDRPEASPRPYDKDRDGMVVGEGAATLILEEYERAKARGATIHAEIVGYGTNCDGEHVTTPSVEGMRAAMELALLDAGVDPARIGYINGHGTGTELGDIAETQATAEVIGDRTPFSSTKSYTGHTLGACGAVESVFCLCSLHDDFLPPTRTLEVVDDRCAPLDYVRGEVRDARLEYVMNNNFAFGGINTSLIYRRI